MLSFFSLPAAGFAGDSAVDQAAIEKPHPHAPMVVRSRPVIERVPLAVIDPIDVCYSSDGLLHVADRRGGVIFRIRSAEQTEIMAEGLDGIRRIVTAEDGSLYVLTATAGSGRIVQYLTNGESAEIGSVNFSPSGLGIDGTGTVLVSSSHSGAVEAIATDGTHRRYSNLEGWSKDLLISSEDQAYVLLQSGRIVRLLADGSWETVVESMPGATRLLKLSTGEPCVLCQNGVDRPVVRSLGRRAEVGKNLIAGGIQSAADVLMQLPAGTVAVTWDAMGNAVLANPQLRAVTRVTRCLLVACPHCGQKVPLVFSDEPDDRAGALPERSF